jgi:hypothetical protein
MVRKNKNLKEQTSSESLRSKKSIGSLKSQESPGATDPDKSSKKNAGATQPPPESIFEGLDCYKLAKNSGNRTITRHGATYYYSHSVCFAENVPVHLASGAPIPIRELKRGHEVLTPRGPRTVSHVLRSHHVGDLCALGSSRITLVTPWHPVRAAGDEGGGGDAWMFPCHAPAAQTVPHEGFVYTVVLEADDDVEAHAIRVGAEGAGEGFWGVTLGHGLREGADVRAHAFFGDRDRVVETLRGAEEVERPIFLRGVLRDDETLLTCGFSV